MSKTYQGKFGSYQSLKTEDGSETLISSHFDEACHSTSGAYGETLYNYVQGCEIIKKAKTQNEVFILEVGLGVGLGPLVTFNALAEQSDLSSKIHFYSLEIDPYLVEWIITYQKAIPDEFPDFSDLEFVKEENMFMASKNGHGLSILIGDARQTVKSLMDINFDAIYQDPFSPKKNPTLWTLQWFRQLKKVSKDSTLMSTYSATQSVIKGMNEAGFITYRRKGFGRKRSTTLASPGEIKCSWPRIDLSAKVSPLLDE